MPGGSVGLTVDARPAESVRAQSSTRIAVMKRVSMKERPRPIAVQRRDLTQSLGSVLDCDDDLSREAIWIAGHGRSCQGFSVRSGADGGGGAGGVPSVILMFGGGGGGGGG